MKPAFWRTVVAAVVLAGLGAYLYFVEAKREDKPDKVKEKVFAGLDKSKVGEVTLTPPGGETVHLVREGTGWRMTAPLAVAADSGEVDALVSSLEALEMDEVVSTTPQLADYGLQSPRAAVTLKVQGAAAPLTLEIGDKTPDSAALYARRPEQPRVFLIPAYVESSLEKKPFDLRDRKLLQVKRDEVRTLSVTGPEESYTLQRDPRGEWVFSRPLVTQAGRWPVDSLLGTLEGLRMESVAAENATEKDLKAYGLAKPSRTVSLGLADGVTRVLEIGAANPDKKRYAREAGNPRVAVIPPALADDLAKGMSELRGKRLLEVTTYDVTGFDAEEGGVKRSYARSTIKDKEGVDVYKWKRTAPQPKELETNAVQDALFKLGGVDVQEFIDTPGAPETYALEAPVLKVQLRFDKGRPPVTVEMGRKGEAWYARREGDEAVLKLDPAKAEELRKAFAAL